MPPKVKPRPQPARPASCTGWFFERRQTQRFAELGILTATAPCAVMECVWQRDHANHAEAMRDIADYIVNFYNSVRVHSTLGNLPPDAFEHQSAIKQPMGVCEVT